MTIEELIINFLNSWELDEDWVRNAKRQFAKANKLSNLPTNIQLLKTYRRLVQDWSIIKDTKFEQLLKKRAIRSLSGIVPIQVLTKPFPCSGECIFCPNDATMPKSYINTEPGAMRAFLNEFDPLKQVYNRLLSLQITGHNTDKIEMIVLWWTFDCYPRDYKISFVKALFDACNTFDEYYKFVEIDENNPKSAKFTVSENLDIKYPDTLTQSQDINETAWHRIIWLTIETRPDYVNDENCRFWRELGVTRIEIGIQSLFDDVLKANKRWTTVQQIRQALHKLRQYWFKFSAHFMPGLYGSDIARDIQTMELAYSDRYIKPDEIKFYPVSVIPNTELFQLYQEWKYKPINEEDLAYLIEYVKMNIIPPYTRIKRLIRDIPSTEIVAWTKTTNMRQLVETHLKDKLKNSPELQKNLFEKLYPCVLNFQTEQEFFDNLWNLWETDELETFLIWDNFDGQTKSEFICLCTRCREIRNQKTKQENAVLVVRRYFSSVWEEFFISWEDASWYLYGFVRLLLPQAGETIDWHGLWKGCALVRELHVYWQLAKISEKSNDKSQHKWFGSTLMEFAEKIAQIRNYKKISVISGIWVKGFYKKIWYTEEGTYVVKPL